MLGEHIRDLRKKQGLTQQDFANNLNARYGLNIERSMISKWETGFQEPTMYNVSCIADFFGVSIDYLNDGRTSVYLVPPKITDKIVSLPVIGEIAAGYDKTAVEDWSGETVEIPLSYLKGRDKSDFFVLSVKGDSMYPLYQNGDKVLILKQSTLNHSGEIGAVIYDNECATLKKVEYVQGEDWLKLIPINPNYMPKEIKGSDLELCRVLGVPTLLIREIFN